jgi:lipid-binding SYLF domain-containing protein
MIRVTTLLLAFLVLFAAGASSAQAKDSEVIVFKAAASVERMRSDGNFKINIEPTLKRAKAVLIVPELLKGGFFVGAEYGNGVLMMRGADGRFSPPAFYTVGGGSFGLQIGLQSSEMMFFIMTDRGLKAVVEDRFRAGAGIGLAVGLLGAGGSASTTTAMGPDIYAFSQAVGVFGGISLDGMTIQPRYSLNAEYYGGNPAPDQIIQGGVSNNHADQLRRALDR